MINQQKLQLLLDTATAMGLEPSIASQSQSYGLVSIKVSGKIRYLFHNSSNPNNQTSSWLAKNKHVTRELLRQHGLPNIPYSLPASTEEAARFLSEHGKIIAKPIKGKKSQGIHLITKMEQLDQIRPGEHILEKFISGQETRFLIVNGQVEAVHQKVYRTEINDPDTVQRISLEKPEWDTKLAEQAIKAADALGLVFTAVDFIVAEDSAYILEINSAPGILKFQHPDKGPAIDMMRLYLGIVVNNYKNL